MYPFGALYASLKTKLTSAPSSIFLYMSLTSFCRSRGVRRFSDERVEARRSIYVDLLTGGKDLSASLGAYLYDGLEQLLGLAARLHHVLALSLGVVVGVMRTLALVPLRCDGARERGVRREALLERAIGRTRGGIDISRDAPARRRPPQWRPAVSS